MSDSQPTVATTPTTPVVNPTTGVPGVNSAQAQQNASSTTPVDVSGMIAQYEQRINAMMSAKDTAINDRNKAITDLTNLQNQYTTAQEQTQSSLTAAANSAQLAIDRSTTIERELNQTRGQNAKLTALMERPHLVPYSLLIPDVADKEKLKSVLDQLEQIRADDIKRSLPAFPAASQQQAISSPSNPFADQNSTLQALYGNRANMNPAFMQPTTPIPASSPAQMNSGTSTDVVGAINQLFAEAKRLGTPEAFEDATRRAALMANSANPVSGR